MTTDFEEVLVDYGSTLIPELEGNLRAHNVKLPAAAHLAGGIRVLGRTIRSIVYTTDIAIIRNCDADAVFAVYPFTPQQVISDMLVKASSIPVFVGVGGGTTSGPRSMALARDAEAAGAYGVVLNAPASNTTLEMVSRVVDIPVIMTVVDDNPEIIANRLAAGASIISVSGGRRTAEYVASLRRQFPDLPIIATGGKTDATIGATVSAGANAVICTPPSNAELFSPLMEHYRENVGQTGAREGFRPLSQAAIEEISSYIQELRASGFLPEPEEE